MAGWYHRSLRGFLWGLRCCNSGIVCLLYFTAAVQALIALFTILGKDFPIPRPVVQFVLEKISEEDWQWDIEQARFDLLGGIHGSGVSLRSRSEGYLILEMDQLWIDLDIGELLFQTGPGVDRLAISNGKIYVPGYLAPSGVDEALLSRLDLKLELGRDWIQVHSIQGHFAGHPMIVDQSPKLGYRTSGRPREPGELVRRWRSAVSQLARLQGNIPPVEGLLIRARLEALNEERYEGHLNLFVAEGGWPGGDAVATGVHVRIAPVSWNGDELNGEASVMIDRLRGTHRGQAVEVMNLRLAAPALNWRAGDTVDTPPHAFTLNTGTIRTPWTKVNGAHAMTHWFRHRKKLEIDASFHHDHGTLMLQAGSLTTAGSGTLAFQGSQVRIMDALEEHLPDVWFRHIPQTGEPVNIGGRLKLGGWIDPQRADWVLYCSGLRIEDAYYEHARARGFSTLQHTVVEECDAWIDSSQYARLGFVQEYPKPRFILTAEGVARRSSLDPILDFPWWREIWNEVSTLGQPVGADVRVEGTWGLERSTRSWVGIEARKVAARGLELELLDLSIAQEPGVVDLYRLRGKTGGGEVTGSLHWRIPDGDILRGQQYFSFTGHLPIPEIRELLGEGNNWIDDFSSEENPHLDVFMKRTREPDPEDPETHRLSEDRMWLNVRMEGAGEAGGIPVRDVYAHATKDGASIRLRHTHVKVAGGEAWLDLDLDLNTDENEDLAPRFGIDVTARTMRHFEALNLSRRYFMDLPAEYDEETPRTLDFDANLSGSLKDPVSYSGSGNLRIVEAELGQVRLFGELSRLFEGVGLPFTTLQLEEATSRWSINEGRIRVSRARIAGPSVRLRGSGDILVPGGDLDFTVQAFVVRGLFGLVFRPVNLVLEFRLGGDITDPDWSFRINPFRWLGLTGEKVAEEPAESGRDSK